MNGREARRVHLLGDAVARQIAAGEVIDRPASVVRELLDNAIDAGADSIDLYIEDGGVRSVRAVDNGVGMTREDLELCWHSHATSKIDRIEDLDRLASLGFRGEALSSIAASSRLTVTSRPAASPVAQRLRVDAGRLVSLDEAAGEAGTVVEAADLFYSLPGRRKFLKTPSAETAMCRATFVEKSLPFPQVAMRFSTGRRLKLFLPAAQTLAERVVAAHPAAVDPDLLHRVDYRGSSFTISIVMGGPSLYRRDRRYIWTYVNNRRISEYALVQAVEYGFADHIPGGNFPIAFVFISIDPELVDFNVHPAKREARFRNLPEVHHGLVTAIREHLAPFTVSFEGLSSRGDATQQTIPGPHPVTPTRAPVSPGRSPAAPGYSPSGADEAREAPPGSLPSRGTLPRGRADRPREGGSPLPESLEAMSGELVPRPKSSEASSVRYLGQVFSLFLIASVDERLFIIDQHAAHERILFERFRANPGPPQNLLVPIVFETTGDEEPLVEENEELCRSLGIGLRRSEPGRWEIVSLPEGFKSLEEEIADFVKQAKGGQRELEQELYARLSCRAAVKEGDPIDEITAVELIRQAFALDNARCPHGRPIWFELSRTELYHLVGRL